MTQSSAVNDRIEVRSSRLWALIHFNMTLWVFPARMVADHVGVSNNVVLFWLVFTSEPPGGDIDVGSDWLANGLVGEFEYTYRATFALPLALRSHVASR